MKLLLILQLAANLLSSKPDSTKIQKNSLDEVVVTALRTETKIIIIPSAITVVTSDYISSRLSRITPEVLMGTVGVFVQKTNHGGGSSFIRGLTGNQIFLLIDGIRLNNNTLRYGPLQYFNTVDPFSISRIEVLKNEGSVVYGSDSLGGTIQVMTRSPAIDSEFHGNFTGRLGTQNIQQTGRGELSYSTETMALTADFTKRNFGDLPGGKNTGIQKNSGYGEQMGNFKTLLKFKKGDLTLAHQYFKASDVPVYHKLLLEDYRVNQFSLQQRNLNYAKYTLEVQNQFFEEINTTLSWQKSKERREAQKNDSPSLT